MNFLPEERESVFAREYVRLENKDDAAAVVAYRRAGFIDPAYPVAVAAERMLARPEIQRLIFETRSKFKPKLKAERSRDSVLADIDAIFESALAAQDHSAAVNCKRLEAQIQGLLQENVTVTHKVDVTNLTDEQLEKIAARAVQVIDGNVVDITPKPVGIEHMHDEPPPRGHT